MERPSPMVIGVASFLLGILLFAGSSYGIMWICKAPRGSDSWGLATYFAAAFVIVMAVVFSIGVLFFGLPSE
jgi:hypothetical protein